MLEIAIMASVTVVSLVGWDAFRRHYEARKVDDRAELEATIKALDDRVTKAEHNIRQVANRPAKPKLTGLG